MCLPRNTYIQRDGGCGVGVAGVGGGGAGGGGGGGIGGEARGETLEAHFRLDSRPGSTRVVARMPLATAASATFAPTRRNVRIHRAEAIKPTIVRRDGFDRPY
ncbi:hypothetical protein HZH66_002724 [Vespula vulgaris]|uniref:Uncharacterized protein n=1 Tax=Vespula vulgaris TaxID=7454 RepID=A0A834KKI7_VESVU|nr:hypothetical protein HZH66_002724 [Vespula vulgaris]